MHIQMAWLNESDYSIYELRLHTSLSNLECKKSMHMWNAEEENSIFSNSDFCTPEIEQHQNMCQRITKMFWIEQISESNESELGRFECMNLYIDIYLYMYTCVCLSPNTDSYDDWQTSDNTTTILCVNIYYPAAKPFQYHFIYDGRWWEDFFFSLIVGSMTAI